MSTNGTEDESGPIRCRWSQPTDCNLDFEDPEDLYNHLCNEHIGRKAMGNLCLSCHFEDCRVSCSKRDHITSHLRVHVPLKPHSCSICGRAFKRPQDLKKHEKLHTESEIEAAENNARASRPLAVPRSKRSTAASTKPFIKQEPGRELSYESSASPYSMASSFSNLTDYHVSPSPNASDYHSEVIPALSPHSSVSAQSSPAPLYGFSDDDQHSRPHDEYKRSFYTVDDFVTDVRKKRFTAVYDQDIANVLDDLAVYLQEDPVEERINQLDTTTLDGTNDFLTQLLTEIGSEDFWNTEGESQQPSTSTTTNSTIYIDINLANATNNPQVPYPNQKAELPNGAAKSPQHSSPLRINSTTNPTSEFHVEDWLNINSPTTNDPTVNPFANVPPTITTSSPGPSDLNSIANQVATLQHQVQQQQAQLILQSQLLNQQQQQRQVMQLIQGGGSGGPGYYASTAPQPALYATSSPYPPPAYVYRIDPAPVLDERVVHTSIPEMYMYHIGQQQKERPVEPVGAGAVNVKPQGVNRSRDNADRNATLVAELKVARAQHERKLSSGTSVRDESGGSNTSKGVEGLSKQMQSMSLSSGKAGVGESAVISSSSGSVLTKKSSVEALKEHISHAKSLLANPKRTSANSIQPTASSIDTNKGPNKEVRAKHELVISLILQRISKARAGLKARQRGEGVGADVGVLGKKHDET